MSSAEEGEPASRRPRLKSRRQRACDMCRRRKVRCDGNHTPDGICTNCVAFKFKCTYVQSAPKRPLDPGYVESLEEQVSSMRSLLDKYRQLYPGMEASGRIRHTTALGSSSIPARSLSPHSPQESAPIESPYSLASTSSAHQTFPIASVPSPILTDNEPEFDPSDDELQTREAMIRPFERSPLFPGKDSFHGKSSSMMFLVAAMDTKREYIEGEQAEYKHSLGDGGQAVADGFSQIALNISEGKGKQREKSSEEGIGLRPTLLAAWTDHPWIMRTVNKPQVLFDFPPKDLLDHLVALYFLEVNPFTPVFHEPSFQRDIEDNLHYRDEGFASVLLLLCAVASKKSDDPRVLLAEERIKNDNICKGKVPETIEHHVTYHSAGWQWFEQVQRTRLGISFRPPSLYDMQVAYLAASYTVEASLSWNGIGYGLRIAQMLGVHRKKSYGTHPTVEGELRKRVFWALVLQDRAHSSVFGRACSIQDEDFDLDLPIACDDEYWRQSDPEQAFKQPEDKPSKVAYFNCMLRLSQIHAYALRTIYSINKSKALLGLVGSDWQQKIVSQIDSALNRWLDSIPPHLRWDPKIKDNLFFKQSVSLHASYYNTCIIVHRPFIPSPRNPTPPSSPSLIICTHAARTCISLAEEEFKRTGEVNEQHSLFMSAIVLLINIWSEKNSTASSEAVREMQLVRRVMQMIKAMEPWGQGSAKIWDALNNLVRLSEMSTAEQAPAGSKRPRGAPLIQPNDTFDPLSMGEREIAGSRRVRNYQQHQRQTLHKPSQTDTRHSINPTIVPSQLHSDDQFSMFVPTSGAGPEHDTSQATYSALSSFTEVPEFVPSGDAMMNPAIDPVMEALLSMLSPTQYQQPQVAPSSATGDFTPDTGDTHNSSAWDNAMLPNLSTAVATSGAQVDSLFPPVTSSKYDPSANWSSAPSGFGWEDWEAYLTNVRQDDDDVLAEHTS